MTVTLPWPGFKFRSGSGGGGLSLVDVLSALSVLFLTFWAGRHVGQGAAHTV